MKKLFLRDGKLWYNEFPDVPTNAMSVLSVLNECEAAVSAAKDSAVEVVNRELIADVVLMQEGQLYEVAKGWTVEIDYYVSDVNDSTAWQIVAPELYEAARKHPESGRSVKQEARLIPLKEQSSGIAAIGVPEYGKGWEGEKFDLLEHHQTIASDRTVKVTFGLQPEHIAFIEERAEKLGGIQSDWLWREVGEKIGWHPHAACSYYADYLRDKLKSVSPPPQADSQDEIWNDCLSLIDTLAREVDDEFGLPMYEDPKGNTIQESIMDKFTITRKAKP